MFTILILGIFSFIKISFVDGNIHINYAYTSQKIITDEVAYYVEINECISNDYEQTDFLVVQNIQIFLSNEGYFNGSLNGYYDSKLENSIKDFQKAMGIRIDGIIGSTTYKTMQKYDSCTKKSNTNFISCFNGDYKAYKACTSPYGTFTLEVPTTVPINTSNKIDCDDGGKMWHGDKGTLWNAQGGAITYENCLEHELAKSQGYDFTEKPIPGVTPGVSLSGNTVTTTTVPDSCPSIAITNLDSAVSIAENQTSVITISATGTGSLTYSLSGTDSRLMSVNSSGVITLNSDADYEQKTSYSANAVVTDTLCSKTKAFTINVTDVSEKHNVNLMIVYDADNLGDAASDYDTVSELTTYMTDTLIPAQNNMFTNSGITNLEMSFVGLYHWTLAEATYAGSPYNSAVTKMSLDFDVYKEKIKKGADSVGAVLPGNGDASLVWSDTIKRRNIPFTTSSTLDFRTGKIFSHEWGHSVGLKHSTNQSLNAATSEGITSYAYGYYQDTGNTFSTTMAYGNVGCGIYANPDKTCAGDDDTTYFVNANDGTKGSQAAGDASCCDTSRVLQEYAHEYERLGAETNYGVSVGSYSVKSNAYFPLIDSGTASYSFTESISETSTGTKTIYVKKEDNVTISSTEYERYTWCDHSSCDLNVTSHTATQSEHKIGLEILINSGNYYLNKVGWSGAFGTQLASANSKDHYDRHFEAPCLFISHYMKTGQYNEPDCSTRFAHQSVYGTSYTDTWSFTNNVKKELVVTPYGAYDAYKYTHTQLSLTGSYDTDGAVQVLKFWFSPEVGVLMFEDELMRRWKLTAVDTDGDGTDNASDTDDDGDGVLDTADAFPLDPNASADADDDGIADGDE